MKQDRRIEMNEKDDMINLTSDARVAIFRTRICHTDILFRWSICIGNQQKKVTLAILTNNTFISEFFGDANFGLLSFTVRVYSMIITVVRKTL